MDNVHWEHIKNLFRWWNGLVFSFEMWGTEKEDDGFDSGMDEAEAALNSDEEFSSAEFGSKKFGDDDVESWYAPEELPAAPQTNANSHSDLSINFMQLTISEHSIAHLIPPAAHANAIAVPWVRQPTLVHSAGAAWLSHPSHNNISNSFDD